MPLGHIDCSVCLHATLLFPKLFAYAPSIVWCRFKNPEKMVCLDLTPHARIPGLTALWPAPIHQQYWCFSYGHAYLYPDSKDPQIDVNKTSIRHKSVGSISNGRRFKSLGYLDIHTDVRLIWGWNKVIVQMTSVLVVQRINHCPYNMILWDITMRKLHKIPNPIWDQRALYQWYVWIAHCISDASRMENVPLRSADSQICPCWSTLPWTDFLAPACHKMADRANHLWRQKTRLESSQGWKVRILMLWQDSSNT